MHTQGKRTAAFASAGVLTALALVLSLADTAVSSLLAFLPGFKLGLANIVGLFALYTLGLPWTLAICIGRCLLAAVFSGQITMLLFSVMGGVGSTLVMAVLRQRLSILKVSMSGGVAHNLLQLAAAALVTATPAVTVYMPVLIVLGTVTGFLIGWLCAQIMRRMPSLETV